MRKTSLPEGYRKNPRLHAYLFTSGDLASRRSISRLIAKSMLCENMADDGEPCGSCSGCVKVEAGTHPDCIIMSDGGKTKVEDVRTIEEEAHLSTNEADSKVFILEDADEYNTSCQNALLKIIEEPPKGVKFVLTASSVSAILPTVRSRVCSLSGNVKGIEEICAQIKHIKSGLDDGTVKTLSYFVEAFDKADIEGIDESELLDYVGKAHLLLSGNSADVMLELPKKREPLMLCLQVFMLSVRQLALVKATGKLSEGILSEKMLSECNAKTSMKKLHMLYDVFEEGYLLAEGYANVNAVLSFLLEKVR